MDKKNVKTHDSQLGSNTKQMRLSENVDDSLSNSKLLYSDSVKVKVGKDGGMYSLPLMGILMIIPAGSLERDVVLTVSICTHFLDFPPKDYTKGLEYSFLAPRVQIEPDDIQYKKHVYLIMNHNVIMELSKDHLKKQMLVFHKSDLSNWELVQLHGSSRNNTNGVKLSLAKDMSAFLTSSSVVISMLSNCRFGVVYLKDDEGRTRPAMKICLMVFADYQEDEKIVNIRVHAASDWSPRKKDANNDEIKYHGGHFIENQILCVLHEENPLSVEVSVNGGTKHSQLIDYSLIRSEIELSIGTIPHASFAVQLDFPDGAAARPTSAEIKVVSTQCNFQKTTIKKMVNLHSILKLQPRQVSTNIHLDRSDLGEVGGALCGTGEVVGESLVRHTSLSGQRDHIIHILVQNLTDSEIAELQRCQGIVHMELDGRGKRKVVLDLFVAAKSVNSVIMEMQNLRILRDEVKQLLLNLSHSDDQVDTQQ